MLKKQGLLTLAAVMLLGLTTTTAAFADEKTGEESSVRQQKEFRMMERTQNNEVWESLTDTQKAELYTAKAAVDAANASLWDKAAELGLMDESDAEAMKEAMNENTSRMKEQDVPPMFGFGIRVDAGEKLLSEEDRLTWPGGRKWAMDAEDGQPQELTEEELAERQAQLEEKLEQSVTEGRLTREQADAILERMKDMPNQNHPSKRF